MRKEDGRRKRKADIDLKIKTQFVNMGKKNPFSTKINIHF
jgi:hypothetical protein